MEPSGGLLLNAGLRTPKRCYPPARWKVGGMFFFGSKEKPCNSRLGGIHRNGNFIVRHAQMKPHVEDGLASVGGALFKILPAFGNMVSNGSGTHVKLRSQLAGCDVRVTLSDWFVNSHTTAPSILAVRSILLDWRKMEAFAERLACIAANFSGDMWSHVHVATLLAVALTSDNGSGA